MYKIFAILFLTICCVGCDYGAVDRSTLKAGDILFQDLDCGDACDAIEKVTVGFNGLDFSHCGIVAEVDGSLQVVEAYGSVHATSIDSFFNRSKDKHGNAKVIAGRIKDSTLATQAAIISTNYIGKPYDKEFKLNDDKYYCSELVYECYKAANNNQAYFPLNKMTFKEPDSTAFIPFWINYYEDLGVPIPEGELGINPGAISRSKQLEIILFK